MTRSLQERLLSTVLWGVLLLALGAATGCGGSGGAATELQRVAAETFDVVVLSPHGAIRHGTDSFVIEFRAKSDGQLVDPGTVKVSATMPMPGMPMFGSVDVKRTEVPGRYTATGQLDMAGTWRLSVEWQGGLGAGSVSFSGTVQ